MIKKYYGCYLPTKKDVIKIGQKQVYRLKERNGKIASVRLALHILYAEEIIEMERMDNGDEIFTSPEGENLVKLYFPDNFKHNLEGNK